MTYNSSHLKLKLNGSFKCKKRHLVQTFNNDSCIKGISV